MSKELTFTIETTGQAEPFYPVNVSAGYVFEYEDGFIGLKLDDIGYTNVLLLKNFKGRQLLLPASDHRHKPVRKIVGKMTKICVEAE